MASPPRFSASPLPDPAVAVSSPQARSQHATVGWYDCFLYSSSRPLVFNRLFRPDSDRSWRAAVVLKPAFGPAARPVGLNLRPLQRAAQPVKC